MRHLAGAPDAPLLPGQHAPLCIDCVAHAPLLVMAGAAALVLLLALQADTPWRSPEIATPVLGRPVRAFRSRAPPR